MHINMCDIKALEKKLYYLWLYLLFEDSVTLME